MTLADQPSHQTDRYANAADGLLDVAGGIERVMGDRALYQRMLTRFCGDYAEGAAPIRRAMASGDLELAQLLAHNLKGAAGMIGAAAVYGQASLLEAALRHAGPPQSDLLEMLDQALAAVTHAIGCLPATTDAHGGRADAPARAPQPVQALLVAQLADFLDRGDSAALELLEQSEGGLKAALGLEKFDAVARAAEEFDFEAALAALRRAKEEDAGAQRGRGLSG